MEQKTKKIGSYIKLRLRNQKDGTYGIIDNLSMTLSGNRPVAISDAATPVLTSNTFNFTDNTVSTSGSEYTYDGCGAMTRDTLGPIGPIFYGPLNIGAASTNIIKPGMTINLMDSTEYLGNFVLTNGKLDKYLFAGGYLTASESGAVFHYYTPDHLGNNRVVVKQDGTIEQVNHYYPYGGVMGESTGGDVQRYKYNGKELNRMHGLDWYDYGARHYAAAIVSWPTIERNDINGYGYTEGYILPTSLKEDAIIKNTFVKSVMKGYDLVMNQCANAIKENNPYDIYIKRQ